MDGYFSEATKRTATGFRRTIHYFVEHQTVASKVTFANQSGSPGVPDPVVRISTSSLRFEGHTLVGSQDQRRDSEGWRNGSIPYSNSPQGRRDLGAALSGRERGRKTSRWWPMTAAPNCDIVREILLHQPCGAGIQHIRVLARRCCIVVRYRLRIGKRPPEASGNSQDSD